MTISQEAIRRDAGPRRRRRGPGRWLLLRWRWWLRGLDRDPPAWLHDLTSWGVSLTVHVAVLLVLALVLFLPERRPAGGPGFDGALAGADQLTEDLTTLVSDDLAGDPFTTLESAEPPSLSLIGPDSDRIVVPELAPDVRYTNNLQRGVPLVALAPLGSTGATMPQPRALEAPFSGRQGESKARLVRRQGGTMESERAVERGIDWIARHQRADGSWALDISEACSKPGCPERTALESDTGATGLALLPMLGAGLTHTEANRHQKTIERGLKWLVASQQDDGSIFIGGDGTAGMYSHAIATMALCEAYGLTGDRMLREPAIRAVDFICAAQSPENGGWRYTPGQAGDTSVLGWQWFALRSAHLAGLKVPDATVQRAVAYLDQAATDPKQATYSYMPGGRPSSVMTAEALLVRQYLGWPKHHPSLLEGASLVSTNLMASRERNIYYWYYATQMLHNMGGVVWRRWNPRVRDGLVRMQVKGAGCDRGSWDPLNPQPDRWGRAAGRLFVTSLSLLTLEVYYRYLPLYQAPEVNPVRR